MVVYDNDQTLSHEARAILAIPGVALYESRILSTDDRSQPLSSDNLEDSFGEGLDVAVRQINATRPSDVVALGCTSAAMTIGTEELERRVHCTYPEARVTDPYTGILSALRVLGSTRVGFVSPYPRDVAESMIEGIEAVGVNVPAATVFHNDAGFARDDAPFISPAGIVMAARKVATADIDTIVISCTQMRASGVITDIEQETGKAVITSNQAMCWHALRLAGCRDVLNGWGRLFQANL